VLSSFKDENEHEEMKFLEAIELLSNVGFKQPHMVIIIYLLQGELKLSGCFSFSNYVCIMKEWI
jgi:hypothetical protein